MVVQEVIHLEGDLLLPLSKIHLLDNVLLVLLLHFLLLLTPVLPQLLSLKFPVVLVLLSSLELTHDVFLEDVGLLVLELAFISFLLVMVDLGFLVGLLPVLPLEVGLVGFLVDVLFLAGFGV